MKDLSDTFSLYIHIPFCVSKCAYCDFLSFADRSRAGDYFAALKKEIEARGKRCDRAVDHIYFGGGTPSIVSEYLPDVGDAIRRAFRVKEGAEISVECNPESVSAAFLAAAKSLGVNRVSIGVQSLSDRLLKRIGRAHDARTAREALDRVTGTFDDVNADLMVGLPEQSMKDVEETTEILLSYPITHLSCYSLIVEKGTRIYHDVKTGAFVPNDDFAVDAYDRVAMRLSDAGFRRYEISNFCLNDKVCKYNAAVWRYADYLGLGLGASSFMKGTGDDFTARRWRNTPSLERYIAKGAAAILGREKIDPIAGRTECIMLALRTERGLDISRFDALFGADFCAEYADKLDRLRDYLTLSEGFLSIKPEYFYVSNSVISELI